jgi:thioredoxin-dependent peroxiredoxin
MHAGDTAPDITLPDQTGAVRSLSSIAGGKRTVLFFYPAAMTSGCTKESCHFRDLATSFAAADAVRVGISLDSVDKQKEFSDKHAFDYPLLSDADGTAAKAFGVKRPLGMLKVRRATFVLDEDLRVLKVIGSEFNMDRHADEALEVLAANPPHGAPSA